MFSARVKAYGAVITFTVGLSAYRPGRAPVAVSERILSTPKTLAAYFRELVVSNLDMEHLTYESCSNYLQSYLDNGAWGSVVVKALRY